jgi:hypothetical protein
MFKNEDDSEIIGGIALQLSPDATIPSQVCFSEG